MQELDIARARAVKIEENELRNSKKNLKYQHNRARTPSHYLFLAGGRRLMLWRLMRRKLEQTTSQRPQFSPGADRLKGRTARRRWSQSTSQYDGKAAAKARTVQCAQSWRLYAGNGTYTNTLGAAPCDLNSCALSSQSDKSSHTKRNTMITDATIQQAKSAVESSELELKGLSEALDGLKVRLPTHNSVERELNNISLSRLSFTRRGESATAALNTSRC